MKLLKTIIVTIVLIGGSHYAMMAQGASEGETPRLQVGIWYDTELQTDFGNNYNHVNLLYLSADYRLSERWKWHAATISIAKTREESLVADLQTFSNIEEDNLPLACALCGVEWSLSERHTLQLGIRNVNEDYFTSPVTSLFVNSSCGIFPTLSCNMSIANYPLASMGVHYSYISQTFNVLASLYNGTGYKRWAGKESVWSMNARRDGLFVMTQCDWTRGGGQYFVGASLHTGSRDDASAKEVVWAYTEQTLGERMALIADYSHAFGQGCECTDFVGLGLQYAVGKSTLGCFTDYARFRHDAEWTTELTLRHGLSASLFVQASCQLIRHDTWQPVGLLRVSVRM